LGKVVYEDLWMMDGNITLLGRGMGKVIMGRLIMGTYSYELLSSSL
jgi:hypothetical protein